MNTPTTWALLNLQNMFGADPFYLDEDGSCAWLDQSFQHPGIIFPTETEQRDILMKGTLTISANYNYLPMPINEHSTSTCQLFKMNPIQNMPKKKKKNLNILTIPLPKKWMTQTLSNQSPPHSMMCVCRNTSTCSIHDAKANQESWVSTLAYDHGLWVMAAKGRSGVEKAFTGCLFPLNDRKRSDSQTSR